jgi:hypothetical protein
MNIRKTGEWNVKEGIIEVKPMWITKGWRRVTGYKTRGYKNRVKLIGRSRMYIDNAHLTMHIKRNRTQKLVSRSYAKKEWIRIR